MIKITKTQHFWLFEKMAEGSPYSYVRTAIEGQSGYDWFIGYEYPAGSVERIGADVSDEKILELEKRFQDMAKIVNI